jgi:hypothetical protein
LEEKIIKKRLGRLRFAEILCLWSSLISATGCSSGLRTKVPSALIVGQVEAGPFKADYAAGEQITGTASETIPFGFWTISGPDRFADGVAYNGLGGQGGAFAGRHP